MEGPAQDAELLSEHLNESLRRLPGPAYYNVLHNVHGALDPANYVEIGVHQGISVAQARETTQVIGVDPAPDIEITLPDTVKIYETMSDDFFAEHDLAELLGGPVQLGFIDGLHLFEQVLRDFINLERYSTPDTVLILHDCLPLNEVTAARERTTDFYAGDVWKATLALRRRRPDLDMVLVPTARPDSASCEAWTPRAGHWPTTCRRSWRSTWTSASTTTSTTATSCRPRSRTTLPRCATG